MNEIVLYEFKDIKVRSVIGDNGEPLFNAKDICDCLDIANSRDAIQRLHNDELVSVKATSGGQLREMNFGTESGLYNLIFRSNKPEAEAFRLWVTSEVLPSIRKTGSYSLSTPEQMASMLENIFVRVARGVSLTPHKRKPGSPLSDEEKDTLERLADEYWAYLEEEKANMLPLFEEEQT